MITKNKKTFETILISIVSSIIIAYFVTGSFVYSYTLEQTASQNILYRIILILILSIPIYIFSSHKYLWSRFLFVCLLFIFVSATLLRDTDPWTQICFCMFFLFILWMLQEPILEFLSPLIKKFQLSYWYLLFFISFLLILIAFIGIMRYLTFRSADFDLGLFSQIFENMRLTGQQISTIERDQLMSHFGVHVSPVFYLMLPVYICYPSPITLQLIQAVFVAISIWPLYLLCTHYKLSQKLTAVVILLYALYPAISGSTFNDFHENCALPFFLLFLIWSYEHNNTRLLVLFTLLTFSIKEDAIILVGCLAFFYILKNKERKKAIILFILSLLYFGVTMMILNHYGDGMLGYMTNFTMNDKNGLVEVLSAIILNPGYSLLQCFNLSDKLYYLCFLIIPLSSALLTKEYLRYLLLAPFFLLNLMPYHNAVYTLGFQYHFGVSVFLFYILIMNLSESDTTSIKTWALLSVAATLILFVPTSLKTAMKSGIAFVTEQNTNQQIQDALEMIPENVSVNASPKLVPYFYQYQEIYPITSLLKTEYVIFDRRPDMMMYEDEILEKYYSEGYEQILLIEDVIEIYKAE